MSARFLAGAKAEKGSGPWTAMGLPLTSRNLSALVRMLPSMLWPPNALVLARNVRAITQPQPWRWFLEDMGGTDAVIDAAIAWGVAWLKRSQDVIGSGGVGDFRFYGWTRGYPEVTGYIIPTVWDLGRALDDGELMARAVRMADWELRVQTPEGGFESLYEGEKQPPVAFNTGQVIRGLVRSYQETDQQRFLEAAKRAGDWMVHHQEGDGSWTKANYLGMKRTYDAYAAAALVKLYEVIPDDRYRIAALANAEFALGKQRENGWFEYCANTRNGNAAPITHTLCYAADGMIEIGEGLQEASLVSAGERAVRAMMERVAPNGWLPGRFDREWTPRARYAVLTGSAQLGASLVRLHRRTGDESALRTAVELLEFLAYVQRLNSVGRNRSGALAGSYPVWGRYVPFKYPSWAVKFFLDHSLLLKGVGGRGTDSPGA